MPSDLKDNLSNKGTWIRLLEVLLFMAIFVAVELVITAVIVLQFLVKLVSGEDNARLRAFGRSLGSYCYQMVAFMCFHSDLMPYPFSPWPTGLREPVVELPAPEAAGEAGTVAAARPARKPRAAGGRTARKPTGRGSETTGGEEA